MSILINTHIIIANTVGKGFGNSITKNRNRKEANPAYPYSFGKKNITKTKLKLIMARNLLPQVVTGSVSHVLHSL